MPADPGDQENMIKMRQRRNSVILAVGLAAVLFVIYLVQQIKPEKESAKAVVQVDGEIVHTMYLDRDEEYTAKGPDDSYNIIAVEDGSVMVKEANCKNQVCVQTGKICNEGEVIACLPHKLIVYID